MRPAKICRLAAGAAFLSALTLLLIAGPASATIDVAGWSYHDLSSLNIPIGFHLAFDDEKIAWTNWHGNQGDVYVADISTGVSTRITDTAGTERAVALDGDRLVWVTYSDLASVQLGDVHLYDLGTHEDTVIAQGAIEPYNGPQIVGDYMAWGQYDELAPGQFSRRLQVYFMAPKTTAMVSDRLASGGGDSGGQRTFALGQGYLAYVEADTPNEDGEAWLLNLSTHEKSKLGSSAADSLHVSLAGDLVTWVARGDGPPKPESTDPNPENQVADRRQVPSILGECEL